MERLEPAWLPSEAEVGVGGAYSPTADVPSVQGRIRSSDGGSCEGFGEKRDNGAGLMLKEKMIIRGLGVNWLLPGCRLSLISHRTDAQRLQTPEQEQQKSRNSSGGPHSALPPPLRPLVRTLPPPPTPVQLLSNLLQMCSSGVLVRGGDEAADKKSGNIQN